MRRIYLDALDNFGAMDNLGGMNYLYDAPINIIWSSGAMFFTSFGRSFLRRFGSLLSVFDTLINEVVNEMSQSFIII